MDEKIVLFWFRRDLRVEDNAGLFYALNSGYKVLPLFVFDSEILDKLEDHDDSRVTFIYDQVKGLHDRFQGAMRVEHGVPIDVFKKILNELPVAAIYTNRDYEPTAIQRDRQIEQLAHSYDVDFLDFKDQVIFDRGEILNDSGEPYKVFTPYKNRWLKRFQSIKSSYFESEKKMDRVASMYRYEMPALSTIGFIRSDIPIPADTFDEAVINKYGELRDYPAKGNTSRLGIHLRHGTISIRRAVSVASELSDVWLNELIWREFYMMILSEFPHVVDRAFKPAYDKISWRNDENEFRIWCEGKTGYPIIDAGMRELNATGYMHNRVRMITASFLTKHLLIDWRWGEAYFARKLLDFELASNNGGWQWAAGTGTDAQPYFRVFNPTAQKEKFDPELKYIKKWVPEFGTSDYPKPIVDHKMARERAIQTYKEALS